MNVTINDEKIFCIGLNKTGTTSIGDAFAKLGYKRYGWTGAQSAGYTARWHEGYFTDEMIYTVLSNDAFEDLPWPLLYKQLDTMCPNAKFILTTRKSTDAWLQSIDRHNNSRPRWFGNYLIYGAYDPSQAPDLYRAKYETHNREVRDYFKDRPGKLLNLVIEDATWNSLCQFLGKPIPKSAFPHSNNSKGGSKLKALIKEQLT